MGAGTTRRGLRLYGNPDRYPNAENDPDPDAGKVPRRAAETLEPPHEAQRLRDLLQTNRARGDVSGRGAAEPGAR